MARRGNVHYQAFTLGSKAPHLAASESPVSLLEKQLLEPHPKP